MLKARLLLLVAALSVSALPAMAQTTPPAAAPSAAAQAGAGATPPDAFLRTLEKRGYSDMKLTSDKMRGGWTGTATKAGKDVRLHLAPNGNSRELKAPKPKAS